MNVEKLARKVGFKFLISVLVFLFCSMKLDILRLLGVEILFELPGPSRVIEYL